MKKVLIFFIILIISFIGCKKDDPSKEFEQKLIAYLFSPDFNRGDCSEGTNVFVGNSRTHLHFWQYDFPSYSVCNQGVAGDTSDGVLNRIDSIKQIKPRTILFEIGGNDLAPTVGNKDPNYVANNIEKIIDNFSEITNMIIVFSNPPINSQMSNNFLDNSELVELNDKIEFICDEKGVIFYDLYSDMSDNNGELISSYTYDGIHFTDEGYQIWIDAIKLQGFLE